MSGSVQAVKHVLVVEDNPDNMYVMDRILSHQGYQVHQANSGEQALHLLRAMPVDLVLLDMQMPGMDGYSAVKALRAMPGLSELPVIAVTASSMAGDRERTLQAGCTDYMPKPVDTRELMRLVAFYLGGS
jgi:two-component system, sensor histidine kinase LadS